MVCKEYVIKREIDRRISAVIHEVTRDRKAGINRCSDSAVKFPVLMKSRSFLTTPRN